MATTLNETYFDQAIAEGRAEITGEDRAERIH